MNSASTCRKCFWRRRKRSLPSSTVPGLARRSTAVAGLIVAMASISLSPARQADAAGANAASEQTPPSTIVEIQDHAKRFVDQSNAAVEALNKIGEVDEVWEAARAAQARARANPDDKNVQKEYRLAQARLLWQRQAIFREALAFEESLRQVYEAFSAQLDLEIANLQDQARTEQAAVDNYSKEIDDYLATLHQLSERIDSAQELAPEEVDVLHEVERFLALENSRRFLAKERVQSVDESLALHEKFRRSSQERFSEIEDQFREAEVDLLLLNEIARNDLIIVRLEQGIGDWATWTENAPQLEKGRSLAHEIIRQRSPRTPPEAVHDPTERIDEQRRRADEFLKRLPARTQTQESSEKRL